MALNRKARGVTGTLPANHVVGRLGGNGNAVAIPISALQQAQQGGGGAACRYIMSFSFIGGVMANNQILGYHSVAAGCTIPPNFGAVLGANSQAGGDANATGSTVITVKQASSGTGSFSSIGTITIGASGITPTFATAGGVAISVAQGNVVRVEGPATADATFSNFFCTLVASIP